MYRRPKDCNDAILYLRQALNDTKCHRKENFSNYNDFCEGLHIILESRLVDIMNIVVQSQLAKFLINSMCPIIEKIIREPAEFEKSITQAKNHSKYAKRHADISEFFNQFVDVTQKCTLRQNIEQDLLIISKTFNDVFSIDKPQKPLQLCYISMKKFRLVTKIMKKRVNSTFIDATTFACPSLNIDMAEMNELL